MRLRPLLIATLLFVGIATTARAATVAYWRFEEGTADAVANGVGSVLDETGSLDGTPSGTDGPIYRGDVGTDPVPLTGASNSLSLQFDGLNDYVAVADQAEFDLTHEVTLEAFFKAEATQSGSPLFKGLVTKGGWGEANSSYQLYYNSGLHVTGGLRLDDASRLQPSTPKTLTAGDWYHAAMVVDIDGSNGGTLDIRVTGITDPTFIDSTTTNIGAGRTMMSNTADVWIGGTSNSSSGRYFTGLIDEARISNVALSSDKFLIPAEPVVEATLKIADRIHDTDFDGLGDSANYTTIVVGEYDSSSNWEDRGFAVFELPTLEPDEYVESATLKLYLAGRDDTPGPADLYHLQVLNRDTLAVSDFEASGNLVVESFVESSDPFGWYQQDVLGQILDDYASDPEAAQYAAFRLQIHDFARDEDGQSERYWLTSSGDNQPVLELVIRRVPEPASAILAATGLVGLTIMVRPRRKRK